MASKATSKLRSFSRAKMKTRDSFFSLDPRFIIRESVAKFASENFETIKRTDQLKESRVVASLLAHRSRPVVRQRVVAQETKNR